MISDMLPDQFFGLGGLVVSACDLWAEGRGFKSRSGREKIIFKPLEQVAHTRPALDWA